MAPPLCHTVEPVGTKLGAYEIRSKIGEGGMGEVYLAEDKRLDRPVALKILPPEFAEDKERMSRFVREAKCASALNHPNIITIYEIGESHGTHFIATEFIDGKTLNEYARTKPFDYKSVLEIAIQLASALHEAHMAGIVHRDIKSDKALPQNSSHSHRASARCLNRRYSRKPFERFSAFPEGNR
jgi:serine/threonine protein kinase